MGFPLICLICAARRVTWLQLLSSYTDRGGGLAAWLRKNRGLVDWNMDFDQLWEMSGQTKWQTHPSVPLPFALSDLSFFFSPFISVDALNLSQWLPDSIKICLNCDIMRLVNLILSQNQIIPYDRMHMCVCACVPVPVWVHCVCLCVYKVFARQDP